MELIQGLLLCVGLRLRQRPYGSVELRLKLWFETETWIVAVSWIETEIGIAAVWWIESEIGCVAVCWIKTETGIVALC